MPPNVRIKDNTKQFLAALQRAQANALNRAITTVRADITKKLAASTGVRQKVIRERLTIEHATPNRLEAKCVVSRRAIPLIEYGARQVARGVLSSDGRLRVGAFLATMKSGHKGAFARQHPSRSRKGLRRGSPALGITELTGPPLPAVAVRQQILVTALAVGVEAYKTRLAHELSRGGAATP